ncbi:MAG: DUF2088 domain-containing protein, partial [Anaerolineae bacterium]|nr:DUF2088 domain-containing protein [Anaerolineae bacterium]
MTTYTLPYGHSTLTFSLPESVQTTWIAPQEVAADPEPIAEVTRALDAPLGNSALDKPCTQPGTRVAIAINDKTRPVPHHQLLPPLLQRLERLGIAPEAVTLLIATGTHTPMRSETFPTILPSEIIARYPVVSHNCDAPDLHYLGTTARGTPIWMNRQFCEADVRIVVGNIEPHHFAGYSGGAKSAAIG